MDATFYVDILRRQLPEIESLLGDEWRFQQDNILATSQKNFLRDNIPEVIEWPSNSPDLNPRESWSIVEKKSDNEWGDIPQSTLIGLVRSMKRRHELVIESNGERWFSAFKFLRNA